MGKQTYLYRAPYKHLGDFSGARARGAALLLFFVIKIYIEQSPQTRASQGLVFYCELGSVISRGRVSVTRQ